MKEHPECHGECPWLEYSYNSTCNLQVDNIPVADCQGKVQYGCGTWSFESVSRILVLGFGHVLQHVCPHECGR